MRYEWESRLEGEGGYSGSQVTGMIKGFFGAVEIFDSECNIFLGGLI